MITTSKLSPYVNADSAFPQDPQEGYKTIVDNQTVYVHPSSALFNRQPDWLVTCSFIDLYQLTKTFKRRISYLLTLLLYMIILTYCVG